MKQMTDVSSRYGAPMGRGEFGDPKASDKRDVRLFRVRINSGGYDDGGAYWGHGKQLWCADSPGGNELAGMLCSGLFRFTRANTRAEAAESLDVAHRLIKRAY